MENACGRRLSLERQLLSPKMEPTAPTPRAWPCVVTRPWTASPTRIKSQDAEEESKQGVSPAVSYAQGAWAVSRGHWGLSQPEGLLASGSWGRGAAQPPAAPTPRCCRHPVGPREVSHTDTPTRSATSRNDLARSRQQRLCPRLGNLKTPHRGGFPSAPLHPHPSIRKTGSFQGALLWEALGPAGGAAVPRPPGRVGPRHQDQKEQNRLVSSQGSGLCF